MDTGGRSLITTSAAWIGISPSASPNSGIRKKLRIYASWGLSETAVDDKVARARATLIYTLNRMIMWDENGIALVQDRRGEWIPLYKET